MASWARYYIQSCLEVTCNTRPAAKIAIGAEHLSPTANVHAGGLEPRSLTGILQQRADHQQQADHQQSAAQARLARAADPTLERVCICAILTQDHGMP
jgi:hypothetical protein